MPTRASVAEFGVVEVVDLDGFYDLHLRKPVLNDALDAELHRDHGHGAAVAGAGELEAEAPFGGLPADDTRRFGTGTGPPAAGAATPSRRARHRV